MRGEGTPADVRRSTAEFRDWRSCTSLFHHGDTSTAKNNRKKIEESHESLSRMQSRFERRQLPSCARLGRARAPRPHTTTTSHHACRLLLHLLGLIVRDERVDNRLQLAVHHLL